MFRLKRPAVADYYSPVNYILKLPYIAGPIVRDKPAHSFSRDMRDIPACFFPVFMQEMISKRGDVFSSFPERRHGNREDVQPVKKILPESVFFYHPGQIPVCCRNEPDIDFNRFSAADRPEFLFLQYPQELSLHLERQVAYLIKENSPSAGCFEQSLFGRNRAGERSFRVPEELRFHKIFGYCAAVDNYKRLFPPGAVVMYAPRYKLLSGAAFARYKDCASG